ncbi:hypothetical protein, partial [Escherichia coli]|uniref:hypothetical protein n=1 Tax=Escherichia coli TaxID=562 RepID=UPI001954507F
SGLVILFVVRPLLKRIVTPDPPAKLPAAATVAAGAAAAEAATPAAAASPPVSAPPLVPSDNPTMRMIEMAQIHGEVHAASLAKVGELVDK